MLPRCVSFSIAILANNPGITPARTVDCRLMVYHIFVLSFFLEIILMSYLHLGERSWSSGYGVGLMTHGRGFNPHTGHGSLLKLRQFHLPRFALVYSAANESQHCWEGTCDGLASCPGESVQLHSNCLR